MSIRPSGPPPLAGGGVAGTSEVIYGDPVSAASGLGSNTPMHWGAASGLLDLTNPLKPVALAAGVYAVTMGAYLNGGAQVGKHMTVKLELDVDGEDATAYGPPVELIEDYTDYTISLTFHVPQGGAFRLSVSHDIGSPTEFATNGSVCLIG